MVIYSWQLDVFIKVYLLGGGEIASLLFFPPDLFSLIYPCSRFLQVWDTERTKVDPDPRVVGSWTKRARGAG